MRVDDQKTLANILCEGKVCFPPAFLVVGMQPVIKNAANAARLASVRQKEIVIAPFFVTRIIGHGMFFTGELHCLVKCLAIRIILGTAAFQNRRQIRTAAKPLPRRYHHAGVHMNGRNMRALRMSDNRNA